ncbi:MAG: hypothetical protein GXY11_04415 [Clostridiales bacterium]|nr:hypothetical protein [Clostridiales bacterium]
MEKDSFVDIRIRENAGSAGITSERVAAITSTVRSSKPLLERITRSASEIVNLRVGDHYHPLGVWYDESIMAYGQAVYDQLNKIQSYAVKFQFEYARLKQLKRSLAADDPLQGRLDFAMAAIEAFYSACEEFTLDGHLISDADWTGTVYAPFADYEAGTFSELTRVFAYIADEMETTTVPFAKGYKAEFDAYEAARINWENDPTEDNKAAVDALYVKLSSSWPADQLYIGMYIMRHVLDIMQFKVDGYLLDIMTIADRAEEVVSLTNYAAADEIGAVGYAADTASAFLAYPVGGVLK